MVSGPGGNRNSWSPVGSTLATVATTLAQCEASESRLNANKLYAHIRYTIYDIRYTAYDIQHLTVHDEIRNTIEKSEFIYLFAWRK